MSPGSSPSNTDRNTVSTAPAAQLGYRLSALGGTDAERDRESADRMLAWVHHAMRDPADGLYWDHVDAAGRIEATKWSYNQGTVIGAELAGHDVARIGIGPSPDRVPATASTTVPSLGPRRSPWPPSTTPAAPAGLAGQGLAFNAIFFRNLLALREVTSAPLGGIVDTVVGVADRAWGERCDGKGSWVPTDGVRWCRCSSRRPWSSSRRSPPWRSRVGPTATMIGPPSVPRPRHRLETSGRPECGGSGEALP